MNLHSVYRVCQIADPDRVVFKNVESDVSDATLILEAAKVTGTDIRNYFHYEVSRDDDGLVSVKLSKD